MIQCLGTRLKNKSLSYRETQHPQTQERVTGPCAAGTDVQAAVSSRCVSPMGLEIPS